MIKKAGKFGLPVLWVASMLSGQVPSTQPFLTFLLVAEMALLPSAILWLKELE